MSISMVIAGFALNAAQANPPRVEIAFPRLIERYCAQVSEQPPRPEVLDEIERRLPELIAAWERDGPAMLAAAEMIIARPYHFSETQAVLHGCEDMGSLSQPLLIAAGRYTDAWASAPAGGGAARNRRPVADFVNSVWHETSHRYLTRLLRSLPGGTTPSRERHRAESIVVRNHMHLFALEQLVYERLGKSAEFQARRDRIIAGGDPELARAHRLVVQEGAERLIAELRP